MKRLLFVTALFIIATTSFSQRFEMDLGYGLPVSRSINWKVPNCNVYFDANYHVGHNFWVGIGCAFMNTDLKPANATLTFDLKTISLSGVFKYEWKFSEIVRLTPQLRFGYVWVKSVVNEIQYNPIKYTRGFHLAGCLDITFKVSPHVHLITGVGYNTMFIGTKQLLKEEVIIPCNFLTRFEKTTRRLDAHIGVKFRFL